MKTLEQIKTLYPKEREGSASSMIDRRDLIRLMIFLPEEDLKFFGIELKEEFIGTHTPEEFTRENVLKQLEKDVAFGFEKALNQRSISSSLMYEVVQMWNWILEEGLEDFDHYPMYGLPLFKATALKYGFNNPIGEDSGSEKKYDEE